MKILMVCLGNICRSPMAEGLVRDRLEEEGIDAILDSAGTSNYHIGEAPDSRAQENMRKNGHDITNLRARQFTKTDFKDFDRIYVMDQSNYQNVVRLADTETEKERVHLFLDHIAPGEGLEVPDPYFGGEGGFQSVYNMLSEATEVVINELKHEKG